MSDYPRTVVKPPNTDKLFDGMDNLSDKVRCAMSKNRDAAMQEGVRVAFEELDGRVAVEEGLPVAYLTQGYGVICGQPLKDRKLGFIFDAGFEVNVREGNPSQVEELALAFEAYAAKLRRIVKKRLKE